MKFSILPTVAALGAAAVVAQEAAEAPETRQETELATPTTTTSPAKTDAEVVGEIGLPVPGITDATELTSSATLGPPSVHVTGPRTTGWIKLERRRYGGLLGEAFVTPQPWQLLNPLAPASYGDGTRHLRRDPYTGRSEGVILFSIRLPGSGDGKSLAERRAKQAAKSRSKEATTPK